ncbi:amidase [Nibrella saemangeumensis]|uniref:Amidase n=1 Tax=Nibrella saemangeumensis TaxID=1084526 RepID=A0ABP8MX79_9BACT
MKPFFYSSRREFLRQSTTAAVGLSLMGPSSFAHSSPPDLAFLSLAEAATLVHRRKVSPVELTQACLKQIELLNPKLNAFITIMDEQAMAQAKQAEDEIRKGKYKGPLHGIPIGIKDNIDTAGIRTTVGSAVFKDRIPTEDAEVIRRLKEAGAVLIGKTCMEEFAYGSTSLTGFTGPVHNPWNPDYIAGGSSGGSAAALAAGMCIAAIGTDTGGSVRIPASICNLTGLKPTYGLISVRGIFPLSYSFDHVGLICRTAQDAALMLKVSVGFDPLDPASTEANRVDYPAFLYQKKSALRIGLLMDKTKTMDIVQQRITEAVSVYRGLGASIQTAPVLPNTRNLSNLLFAESGAIFNTIVQEQSALVHPKILPLIGRGKDITPVQLMQGYQELALLRHSANSLFRNVDVLMLPTLLTLPLSIFECADKSSAALSLEYLSPFNRLGLPAISIPCGFSPDGLPIGLQIVGPRFGEAIVLAVANQYQQATIWHKQHPNGLLSLK